MTQHSNPVAQLTTLDDLSPAEQDRVLELIWSFDMDALAASAGMTRDQLDRIPMLYGRRGHFRTPYPLVAAIYGYGYDNVPADSLGTVLRRVGFKVNKKTNTIDKGNYNRAHEAAAFYGLTLPLVAKDGPAAGESARHDAARFTAAWSKANTLDQLAELLGQSSSGDTNQRNMARGAELGLPDKFSKQARAERRAAARAAKQQASGTLVLGKFPAVPADVRRRARALQRARARAAARAGGCRNCGGVLATQTATGKGSWSAYCSDRCRRMFQEQQRQAANLAEKKQAQEPCEHCGAAIAAGPRAKRFCGKPCAKAANYQAKRAGR